MVYKQYGPTFKVNIPSLEQRTGFTRSEIIDIYSRFKALCHMTLKEKLDQNKRNSKSSLDTNMGLSYNKFKMAVPELKFETEQFARRVFNQCNQSDDIEHLDWENFLMAVKAIQAKGIDQKIDMFFRIID